MEYEIEGLKALAETLKNVEAEIRTTRKSVELLCHLKIAEKDGRI